LKTKSYNVILKTT